MTCPGGDASCAAAGPDQATAWYAFWACRQSLQGPLIGEIMGAFQAVTPQSAREVGHGRSDHRGARCTKAQDTGWHHSRGGSASAQLATHHLEHDGGAG